MTNPWLEHKYFLSNGFSNCLNNIIGKSNFWKHTLEAEKQTLAPRQSLTWIEHVIEFG